MRHRLILSKVGSELVLEARAWDGAGVAGGRGELIATQIVEDFTPVEYFRGIVRERFPEAKASVAGDVLSLRRGYSEAAVDETLKRMNVLSSPERYGRVASDYPGLIGKTPLLKLGKLAQGCGATVLVKLECMEPNSVKDRPVLSMVAQAIARGEMGDETEVIEASSGNVAFALSSILYALTGKKPKVFISKMHGAEKRLAVRVSGCPILLTPAEEGSAGAKRASVKYAEEHENVFQLNQHGNPDNPRAHRLTTGPEIYHQSHVLTGQGPAEFVTGVGSGGTAVGIGMFREDIGADFRIVAVEPAEASLLTGGSFHAHHFSGIAPGFIPGVIKENRALIDAVETMTSEEGFEVCRRLLIEEGLLVGASTGASIGAALRRAKRPENAGKVIVTIAHDRGDRYLSMKDLFVPPEGATEEEA